MLTYCEADTGIVLNRDGSRWLRENGTELFKPTFESLEEAQLLKDKLLAQTPNGEVVIESGGEYKEIYRNEEQLARFMEERETLFAWKTLPPWIRIFKPKPKCKLYKMG
jgi:hypothetical protein